MSELRSFQALAHQVDCNRRPPDDEQQRQQHLQTFQAALQLQAQQHDGREPAARWRRITWLVAAAAAAVVLSVGAFLWGGPTSRGLLFQRRPFEVRTGQKQQPGHPGRSLHAAAGQSTQVRFAGGSQLRLEPGAEIRVTRSLQSQVWCVILRGTVHASVRRAPGASWFLAAGPYQVQVVGTRFRVQWVPRTSALRVRVSQGQVRVLGPGLGPDGIAVSSGRELRVAHQQIVLRTVRALGRSGSTASAQAGKAVAEPLQTMAHKPPPRPTTMDRPRPAKRRSASQRLGRKWNKLLHQGHYEHIVREAVSHKLAQLPAQALWALAHAYRYTHRVARAIAALKACRRRFPRATNSRRAAYLLGRLYLDRLHQRTTARRWFERYLKESPRGPLAGAARAILRRTTAGARQP